MIKIAALSLMKVTCGEFVDSNFGNFQDMGCFVMTGTSDIRNMTVISHVRGARVRERSKNMIKLNGFFYSLIRLSHVVLEISTTLPI